MAAPAPLPTLSWDKHATIYERTWERSTALFGSDAIVLGRLPEPSASRWLDVGCGPGEPALTAVKMGYDVTAIDSSEPMIKRINERIAALGSKFTISALQMDGEKLEGLEDASFDVVSSMFSTFLFPDRNAAWTAALRVLKPGGRLLATSWDLVNNNGSKMVRFVSEHAVDKDGGSTQNFMSPTVNRTVVSALFREELEENGFTGVEVYTLSHPQCFSSGEEYITAILDNPILMFMIGHKEEESLKRSVLDFVHLVVTGVDPFGEEGKSFLATSTGSAENHPLWTKPFTFPITRHVAVATKPSV